MSKNAPVLKTAILALSAVILILGPSRLLAQAGADDKDAVIKAALDYSDGAYSGDDARMERAIYPDLNKLTFRRLPSKALISSYSTYSILIEMLRVDAVPTLPVEKRRTETAILDLTDDVACVRVKTAMWCDYLQLTKASGQWKIINVLWTNGLDAPPAQKPVPNFDAAKESPAAQAAALDFLEGRLSGDSARLEKVIHPETSLVTFMTGAKTGNSVFNRSRFSGILEAARAKIGLPPEGARKAEVRVLDLMDGMAFAVGKTGLGTFYLQLQLMDGSWKAINVLFRPANNLFPPAPPAKK